jgi:integrase
MVDLETRLLRVQQRADAFNAMGSPKSRAGRREIPLSPLVANTLREWKLACPKGALELVFPNTFGTLMHASDVSRLFWHSLMKLCGLVDLVGEKEVPRYEFRHLRHVAASLFIAGGAAPKRIQEIMGHSSIRVTYDIYGHLFADRDADQELVADAERRLLA